jgi:hypothetical protein
MNSLIIKGAPLIDGTGRSPMQNGAVRIEGDRNFLDGVCKKTVESGKLWGPQLELQKRWVS